MKARHEHADVLIRNIKTLYTNQQCPPLRGKTLGTLVSIDEAWIAVKDGKIMAFGNDDHVPYCDEQTIFFDAEQTIVTPGFIDSHTHLVHGGSREAEFEALVHGVPYLEILRQGGGIHQTVKDTRRASFDDLYIQAKTSLDVMLSYGVTTIEAKSGYGLDIENERKQLLVAEALNRDHPMTIVSTYMGAHAIPPEHQGNPEAYVKEIIKDLSVIKDEGLATSVDVFCEEGVFTLEQTERILKASSELGFMRRLHADEIKPLGGAGLGVRLGARSVDHLLAISDEDIKRLSESDTVANLLPGTAFYLGKTYARAREMIDAGVAVSVSGDYNPGSSPTENFQFIMQLAASKMRMTPEEIINAVTVNAAYHLGLSDSVGSIAIGKRADLVMLDVPNLSYVFYHYGINHVKHVMKDGIMVISNKNQRRSQHGT